MDEGLLIRYPDLEQHHFWWVTRRRLVRRTLADQLASGRQLRVLDVGCGSGLTGKSLTTDGVRVVGVDVAPPIGDGDDDIERVVADYLDVAGELGEFDVVLALDAVEHFEDESAVISALRSNLASGGTLVMTVPAYQWLWSAHDVENHHYRRYTRSEVRQAVSGSGLVVQRCGYIFLGLLPPKIVAKLIERWRKRELSIAKPLPGWLNTAAKLYFGAETALASRLTHFLPGGTSVVCVASNPRV